MSEENNKSVAVDCPEVLIPSADDLEKIIIQIGNTYGWEYIKPIEELLGAFPLSHTWNGAELDIPELEWEGKIQCIIEEFKLYPIVKIAEFLSVPLTVVVPPFGITIECDKLFSDPDYKIQVLKQLEEKVANLDSLISEFSAEGWNGEFGIDSPDIKLSIAWKEMIEEIKKILMSGGFSAIAKLLDKEPLATIIESLPEPIGFFLELIASFPKGGYEFDADALFKQLRKQAEEEGLELIELLKQTEIPFVSAVPAVLGLSDVLPQTLGDLIDLDIKKKEKKIEFPRWDEQKLFERFKTFIKDLPQILFEACLAKLTELIKFFIPPEIPIPFTLCTFLSVIGFPKQIDVVELALEGT
tara:strand:- start:2166 stop:3233 length:1068 start_codon:yes stop_codon:yes gene_type:complete